LSWNSSIKKVTPPQGSDGSRSESSSLLRRTHGEDQRGGLCFWGGFFYRPKCFQRQTIISAGGGGNTPEESRGLSISSAHRMAGTGTAAHPPGPNSVQRMSLSPRSTGDGREEHFKKRYNGGGGVHQVFNQGNAKNTGELKEQFTVTPSRKSVRARIIRGHLRLGPRRKLLETTKRGGARPNATTLNGGAKV